MKRALFLLFAFLVVAGSIGALVFKVRWRGKTAQAANAAPAPNVSELDKAAVPLAEEEGFIGVLVPPEAADLASRSDGKLTDETSRKFLTELLAGFKDWILRMQKK